jgi:peptidoglycan hydrolase CwlO-like protein
MTDTDQTAAEYGTMKIGQLVAEIDKLRQLNDELRDDIWALRRRIKTLESIIAKQDESTAIHRRPLSSETGR